jgi:hypothetical protein
VPPRAVPPKTGRAKKGSAAKLAAPRALRDARLARASGSPAGLALPRTPFILLVLGLLGGGLVCLLVVNTTLGATSFRLSQLQRENGKLSLQEQSLQGKIQDELAPDEIAQRAYQLGMRAETNATILDLRNGRYYTLHDPASALVAAGATGQTTGVTKTAATKTAVTKTAVTKTAVSKTGATGDHAKYSLGRYSVAKHRVAKHRVAKHRVAKQGAPGHRTTTNKAGSGR